MGTVLILVASLSIHATCIAVADRMTRIFITILFLSHLYFCGGGYVYWVWDQDGYFGEMYWEPGLLERSIITLSLSTMAVALIVTLIQRRIKKPYPPAKQIAWSNTLLYVYLIPTSLGLIGCVVVLFTGINIDFEFRNPFLLIAYQFSDVLIACILFAAAVRGRGRSWALGTGAFFFVYAVIVGFRYKLALVLVPILFWYLFETKSRGSKSLVKKVTSVVFFGFGGLLVFSLMTIFRVKFGTPDFDQQVAASDLIYSFFAESNIQFGLTAILATYVDHETYYFFAPVLDAIKELVPHVLFPSRTSGLYLLEMQLGFLTDAGSASGTAYPFVGEFAIMGGYVGIVIGTVLYALSYVYLHNLIRRKAPNFSVSVMGIALLATLMGYYHYSRGYLPQATKSYLFVLVPYILLSSQSLRNMIVVRGRFVRTRTATSRVSL
jgi:hypothetical protein